MMELKKLFFQGNRLNFILAFMGVLGQSLISIATAFLLKNFVDISIGGNMKELYGMLLGFVLFLVVMMLVDVVTFVFTNRFIYRGMKQYKNHLFDGILHKHMGAFMKQSTSVYVSALSNDTTSIETNYLQGIFQIMMYGIMFVAGIAAMAYLHVLLMICVLVASMIPLLISIIFGKYLSETEQKTSQQNASFIALMKDLLSGFSVIKSFQAEQEIMENYQRENQRTESIKKHRRDLVSLITLVSSASGFIVNIVVFGLGAYFTIQGEISAGTMIAFVQLLNFIIMPIEQLPVLVSNRKASATLIVKAAASCAQESQPLESVSAQSFQEAIELRDVSFAYEEEAYILQDINMTFHKGKRYAIVGASGSGKSTLLQLLLGYYETSKGTITLDEVAIEQLKKDDLYNLLSVIQQNVFVFDHTLIDNITMFKNFSEAAIQQAIEQSGLSALVQEKGREYLCGENGSLLSGGEKQRISIARTLLKNTPILLMDEATAALDTATSYMIEQSILDIENLTSIIVTHKMEDSLLRRYDEILVLHNGSIAEKGTFDELYEHKGYFYSLYTVAS